MREYLVTITVATFAAWLLQHGAPPACAQPAPPPTDCRAA